MDPRTRLTLDLIRSFPRADNKLRRIAALGAYAFSEMFGDPTRERRLDRWRARHPLHAYILLTSRCNMSCEDCFFVDIINKKSVGRLDFDLPQIEQLYAQPMFRAVSRVVLFGGEPTLVKDCDAAIRFLRGKGIVVTLTSNVLRLKRDVLERLRASDLNMLNMSIYPKTEAGKIRNLDKIERAFAEAHAGAFDPERMVLSFHGITAGEYEEAYAFARSVGTRHLLFNRTFYTAENPYLGPASEAEGFGEVFDALCRRIKSEGHLNLYFATMEGDPGVCPYTTNAISVGPNDTLSPCCMVTPAPGFGTMRDPDLLLGFKDRFIGGEVPKLCEGCQMLGAKHF